MLRLAESQYLHQMSLGDLYRFGRTLWHWSALTASPRYFPEFLWLETTNACNLRCRMCPQSRGLGRPAGRMDAALYRSLLEQAAGRAYGVFLFFGGDPLCDPEYAVRVREARERGLRVFVHTNAVGLDAATASALLDAGPSLVSLSLDTADPDRYAEWRRPARFEETLENVQAFLELARRRPAAQRPLTLVQLLDVDGSGPRDRAELTRRLAPALPDEFRLRPLHDWAGALGGELAAAPAGRGPYYPCWHLWKSLVVGWDGRAFACCNDLCGRLVVGDATAESLQAIFSGEAMTDLRRRLLRGRPPELCAGCVNLAHPLGRRWPVRLARRLLGGAGRLARARQEAADG
jgi:pyruvate-formate lyase-activating enzyme